MPIHKLHDVIFIRLYSWGSELRRSLARYDWNYVYLHDRKYREVMCRLRVSVSLLDSIYSIRNKWLDVNVSLTQPSCLLELPPLVPPSQRRY